MGRKSISDIRKPEILEHVYEVVRTEGLQGTTLSKIADRMGVNSSLLIHYFKTKDDIMVALTDTIIEKYLAYFNKNSQRINKLKDPKIRLNTLLDLMFDPEWDKVVEANVFYACFYLSFKNKKVKKRIAGLYLNFKKELAKEIREHYLEGSTGEDNSEKAAVALISMLEGYGYLRAATGSNAPNGEYLEYLKSAAKQILSIEINNSRP